MRTEMRALLKGAQSFLNRLRGPESEDSGIALALGGGFARGVAHIGVLRVLEREKIPIRFVAGVSAGSIVATGLAGGADSHALERVARSMKFKDVAGWRLGKLGLVCSGRMESFLRRTLPVHRFEDMRIPLIVVATDLQSGEPHIFHTAGDVFDAVRASCSYPGLFHPVSRNGRMLVDGAISMEIPALALRNLGVRRIVSIALPPPAVSDLPGSMFAVVNRCFQIMQRRTERDWRKMSDLVITPVVSGVRWDDFSQAGRLIEAGMQAAEEALPALRLLAKQREPVPAQTALAPVLPLTETAL